jgi:hypothetical protein
MVWFARVSMVEAEIEWTSPFDWSGRCPVPELLVLSAVVLPFVAVEVLPSGLRI